MRPFLTHRLIGRLASVTLTVACFTLAARGAESAQPPDPAAARAAKQAATQTFLDRSRPDAERLEAAARLGYPEDATFAALLAIGADTTQSDAIRLEALRRHRYDEKFLDVVLAILSNPRDGGVDLDTGLIEDVGRRTTFRLPVPVRQRVLGVIRTLLDDPRDRVRLQAYRVLVGAHDEGAINRIADALRRNVTPPVPLAEAIDLIDQAGSVNYITALRPYLKSSNPAVQAQAARALAVDAQSRSAIVALATNAQTPVEVRLNALRALAREDQQFGDYALPLIERGETDPRVREGAMQAFVGRMNYTPVESATQIRFAQAVERFAADASLTVADGARMRSDAQQLHTYLQQAFPEIRKFYEKK
jgi:hypothetical protein